MRKAGLKGQREYRVINSPIIPRSGPRSRAIKRADAGAWISARGRPFVSDRDEESIDSPMNGKSMRNGDARVHSLVIMYGVKLMRG